MNMAFSSLKKKSLVLMLVLSSVMALSASSWLMLWVLMEMNMMAMCFLLNSKSKSLMMSNSALYYFIIQAMASSVMVMAVYWKMGPPATELIVLMVVFTKMGAWPSHSWYMSMINKMQLNSQMVIMMTWQKIIPMMIMSLLSLSILILTVAMVTLVMPAFMLSYNMSFKSVIALSSLNSNSWLILSVMLKWSLFAFFLAVYTVTLMLIVKHMKSSTSKSKDMSAEGWETTLGFMNLGGVPPLMMFCAKVMVLKSALMVDLKMLSLMLVVISCVFLYFYCWAMVVNIMKSPKKSQFFSNKGSNSLHTYLLLVSSTMGLTFWVMLGLTKSGYLDSVALKSLWDKVSSMVAFEAKGWSQSWLKDF